MSEEMNLLTHEELCFFKEYGYLLKRKAVNLDLCVKVLDRMWETAPASVKREDPASWKTVPKDEESRDPLLIIQGTRWQFRGASTEKDLIELIFCRQLVTWAEQLLGEGTLRQPKIGGKPMGSWGPAWPNGPVDPQLGEGARGIYATLPSDRTIAPTPDRLHTDGHPFHLGVVCLLDDGPRNGGSFKIWPGSHKRFYPLFPMQYDQARIPYYEHMPSHKGLIHPPAYVEEVTKVEADTEPVECYGEAGDIVFWHHRLGHMAGHNYAEPNTIRQAVLYDFCKTDLDAMRLDPPQEDMWRDWGDELRAATSAISKQFAAEQRLPIAMAEGLEAAPS